MPFHPRICAILTVLSITFAAGPQEGAAQTTAPAEIVIGVRDDAPPFVWTEPSTGNHLGFLWDICTRAVERTGNQFSTQPVSAADRKTFLTTGAQPFDLLCDPTTITIARMHTFSDRGTAPQLSFSPIVFVASGTYASPDLSEIDGRGKLPADRDKLDEACGAIYDGLVPLGTKPPIPRWIQMLPDDPPSEEDQGSPKTIVPNRYEVWAFVEGSTIGERIAAQKDPVTEGGVLICPRPVASHREAAQEFCEKKIARYFGDADIVRAAIAEYSKQAGVTCPEALFWAAGTYEPYAFVTSSKNHPDFPERFSIALYEMFSDGTIDRLFAGHFPGMKKSPLLSNLFQINSIPEGDKGPSDKVGDKPAQ